jgi:putative ABC transport system substrate-binding protein
VFDVGRRDLIVLLGGAVAAASICWPLRPLAQQPAMAVIGYLSIRSAESDMQLMASFRQGLSAGGFTEGRNVALEHRYAQGPSRLPSLAADLVRRQVAIIATTGGAQAALAAKSATSTIPIVFTVGADPVKAGLVPSLNRPGGNLTGVTTSYDEAAPKRLGLLREILPKSTIIGVLVNPTDPITATGETNDMRAAARSVGQQIEILQASTEREIDAAFARLTDMRADALVVAPDALFATQARQLVALAERRAIPLCIGAVSSFRQAVS